MLSRRSPQRVRRSAAVTEEHKNVRPTEAQVSDERTIRQRGAQKVQPDAREPVQAARLEANNCVSTSSAT